MLTTSGALAGCGFTPRLVCSAPAGMVLLCVPEDDAVTSTAMEQPPLGTVAPLASTTLVALAGAVTVPVQVFTTLGGLATLT